MYLQVGEGGEKIATSDILDDHDNEIHTLLHIYFFKQVYSSAFVESSPTVYAFYLFV